MQLKRIFRATQAPRTWRLLLLCLLSLLIHALLVDLVFEYGFQTHIASLVRGLRKQLTPTEQKKLQQSVEQRREALVKVLHQLKPPSQERKARLVAKKRSFGWVMFDQQPEIQQFVPEQQIPTTLTGSVGQANVSAATEDKPQAGLATPAAKQLEAQVQGHHERSVVSERLLLSPSKGQHKHDIGPTEKTVHDAVKNTQIASTEKLSRVPELDAQVQDHHEHTKPTANKILPEPAQPPPLTLTNQSGPLATEIVRGATAEHGQQRRNIISLTKGFIEKLEGEDGNAMIDRDGDPNKQPTLEELREVRYHDKILWCLQASWKQNFASNMHIQVPEGNLVLDLIIDRTGKLLQAVITESSGNNLTDQVILKTAKFATPFPPMPEKLPGTSYQARYPIHVFRVRDQSPFSVYTAAS